ncbi:hypothetical protein HUW62_21095 [Myxococcus sp. AM011]|uniref:hypothetical protein n=1 Tax=Myxococcus sp. AM011 TaxID=2745200 RepID=UPI001595902C|nr:hypothetical protein [Myxococcus sp. AM011]NVJ23727.1 hypothetical protein [Myxococcus sp. AM011]
MIHASSLPPASAHEFWRGTGIITLAPLIDEERFLFSLDRAPAALLEHYAWPLVRLLELPMLPHQVWALASGHCGMAEAIQLAERELSARRLNRIIVLGADSYVDPLSLGWLAQHRRLKSPTRQTGTVPGEAGACVLLESEVSARTRGAVIGGHVEATGLGVHADGKRPPPPALGRALAEVVKNVLPGAKDEQSFHGELLLDLNGEDWKAQAWGYAQVLLAEHLDLGHLRVVLPCESLGEIGAASGPASVCLAVSGFLRVSGPGDDAMNCSISDCGQVAAVRLRRPASPRSPTLARS